MVGQEVPSRTYGIENTSLSLLLLGIFDGLDSWLSEINNLP